MKKKRWLSLGLAAVLAVTACGCGKHTETAKETVNETAEETEKTAEEAVGIARKALNRSADQDAEKEETVYVNADANGGVKEITVSNWLKNGAGAGELTDITELADVVNVKGDETFTQDGNTYIWAADGRDIYYQGTTSAALPVNVKVSYYLDEEEIAPTELAGRSGRVKIRFDYENLCRQQTVIGGEETELCVPFVAASTMVLDSDRFVNVQAENGRILSDGKNTIVAGVAMPGLYDSLDFLNLDGFEDVDIPEYVEVTADVTDFKLGMTATILMPDVFGDLNTDDMDGFDDLKDDIEELNDATYELIDGCIELDDGVKELKDNMPDLWDGAVELDDGAAELNDGAWELDDGAKDLRDGAKKLNEGARDLRDGAKELDQGAGTLQAGLGLLNGNLPKLTDGVNMLTAGLRTLQDSMMLGPDGKSGDAEHPYIKTSVGRLKAGVDQLAAGVGGMGTTLEQAIAENQKKMQTAQTSVMLLGNELQKEVEEAKKLESQLKELAAHMGMLPAESGADQSPAAETPVSPRQDSEEHEAKPAAPAPSKEKGAGEVPDSGKEPGAAPDGEGEPETVPESGEEPGEVPAEEETTVPEDGKESDGVPAGEETAETSPEDGQEPDAVPEEPDSRTEEPEDDSETENQSEFAQVYLDSLSKSDGMTSMSIVQTSDAVGERAASDPAAMEVIRLQTRLIEQMKKITELQEQLRAAATEYAGYAGADAALKQVAGQLSGGVDAEQLAQLTEGMAALETSVGQIYDAVDQINRQTGALSGGAAELKQGTGDLKAGADALKKGTKKLYQGGVDLRNGADELYDGTKELKEGTEELKDGTQELKDGTQELKDGVVDLVEGVDELKDGTTELLDGVHEYNDDGIQKLYDTVNGDLQNLLDRVDAVSNLSEAYQSFSGKSDAMKGKVKFIIETEAIELDEED